MRGGSYDRNLGKSALHVISAWASTQRKVLAQMKVEDKSNEITAIPALLELLDITGAIITRFSHKNLTSASLLSITVAQSNRSLKAHAAY